MYQRKIITFHIISRCLLYICTHFSVVDTWKIKWSLILSLWCETVYNGFDEVKRERKRRDICSTRRTAFDTLRIVLLFFLFMFCWGFWVFLWFCGSVVAWRKKSAVFQQAFLRVHKRYLSSWETVGRQCCCFFSSSLLQPHFAATYIYIKSCFLAQTHKRPLDAHEICFN